MQLKNNAELITCDRGIGLATARLFVNEGSELQVGVSESVQEGSEYVAR